MYSFRGFLLLAVGLVLFIGMSSCANAPKITRTDAAEQIDLSGNWNDTDSQLVSTAMVGEALTMPWVNDYKASNGRKPTVIVGNVRNKSHEHINTETFIKDLERALINSGKVTFVASSEQRAEIRQERIEQAQHASMETAKSAGMESGADFMLKGQINTIMDEAGKTSLKYYQIELELISITNNEKVWMGQKKIKKIVQKKKRRL
ncbi:penicillin-binding protein activator LpoB [Elusimicrobiota bacterium]